MFDNILVDQLGGIDTFRIQDVDSTYVTVRDLYAQQVDNCYEISLRTCPYFALSVDLRQDGSFSIGRTYSDIHELGLYRLLYLRGSYGRLLYVFNR